ncbi:MAG: peptidase and in kexin sedolisin [Conexibacter sp.]|nr:peptidase and in kexin sedolisin [Conexibacter sp.]
MARRALLIVGLGLLSLVVPAVAGAASSSPTGRLVVLTRAAPPPHGSRTPATAHAAATALAGIAAAGAERGGPSVPQIGLVTVRPRGGESLAALTRRLRTLPGVATVEPERRMTLRAAADDPALVDPEPSAGSARGALPAGTPLEWWLPREGFPAAWEISRGSGALVGVIDTGVDATHPDLAGKIERAVDQQSDGGHTGSATTDEDGHGTHVASLACAATGNGIGIAGAGHDCRLVVEKTDLGDASIAASIVDATDHGVQAINMSFGDDGNGPASPAIVRAIAYAYHRNVVLVAAAADRATGEQGDPANLLQPSWTGADLDAGIGLAVTAASAADRRASFAGFGTEISLAAYGTAGRPGSAPAGLLGAFPAAPTSFEQASHPCFCRTSVGGDSRYGYLAGTSMAAPQVAATAALVRVLNPDLRAHDVVRLLKETARRPAQSGWSSDLGWGIVDPRHALVAARAIDRRAPVSRLTAPRRLDDRTVVLDWTASDPAPAGVVSSGVRTVEVYARRIGGRKARLIARTRRDALTFTGAPHARYAFFTRAIDRAGNRERRTSPAPATIASG